MSIKIDENGFADKISVEIIGNYAKVTNLNIKPPLTFLVDAEDLEIVKGRRWCENNHKYIQARGNLKLHRLVMNAKPGEEIDHINGDKHDDRKANLRFCTRSENNRNACIRSDNSSGFKGVSWHKSMRKWVARISVDGKRISIGYFPDKKSAAAAYNQYALKYHKNFAKLNNIT